VAGKIIADIIEAPVGRISLNVANVTVASINASGVFSSTGNLLITQAGTIGTGAITDGAVTTAKIASSAIVGTVSQSGGVPTGAIIERGSNANGEFVKYADGTVMAWKRVDFSGVSIGPANDAGQGATISPNTTMATAIISQQTVINSFRLKDASGVGDIFGCAISFNNNNLGIISTGYSTASVTPRWASTGTNVVTNGFYELFAVGRWF
jgi:hypothetical protein